MGRDELRPPFVTLSARQEVVGKCADPMHRTTTDPGLPLALARRPSLPRRSAPSAPPAASPAALRASPVSPKNQSCPAASTARAARSMVTVASTSPTASMPPAAKVRERAACIPGGLQGLKDSRSSPTMPPCIVSRRQFWKTAVNVFDDQKLPTAS